MTILDTPAQIELYRLNVLKHSLALEIRGFSRSGGVCVLPAVNDVLQRAGLPTHRRKKDALAELEGYIKTKEAALEYMPVQDDELKQPGCKR